MSKEASLYALGLLRHDKDDEREALEAAANRFIEEAEQAKWPRALQWFENLSFLCGNHLTRFYYGSGGLQTHIFGVDDTSPHDSAIAQVSDNRLVRPFETVIGMLTQTRPKPRVAPNSSQIEDEDAAKVAELVIDLLFENPMRMTEKRQEAGAIAMICGSSYGETEYGESDIPVEVEKLKVKKQLDPMTGKKADTLVPDGTDVVFQNDIATTLWTPFHLSADPRATSDSDALFFLRSNFEDLEKLRELYDKKEDSYYPEALDALGDTDGSRYSLYWWSRFQDVLDAPQHWWHGAGLSSRRWMQQGTAANQAFTTVIDVKPTKQFPRGRTLVMVNKRLVVCGDARSWSQRYNWRWHPYSFFHWLKLPGRFLGMPLLSILVPLQKRINAIDALVQANREYMSIGQWSYARQSRVTEGQIGGIPGSHVQYTAVPGVAPPTKVQNVPLPGELLAERAELVQAIDTISAAGIIGAEGAPSALRAGVMIDQREKERLRSKGPMLASYERFIEGIGQNTLIEIQLGMEQNDEELTRRINAAGARLGMASIQAFTGASLRDHHAVEIDVASELLNSPEAKREMAATAFQYAGPNAGPSMLNALMRGMGLEEFMTAQQSVAVERARRLISRVKAGNYPLGREAQSQDVNVRAAALGLMPGIDEPSIMAPVFREYILGDLFQDDAPEVKQMLVAMFDVLSQMAQIEAAQIMKVKMAMQQAGAEPDEPKENQAA